MRKLGLFFLCLFFAIGVVFALLGVARASTPTLTERLVHAQASLQSKTDEPVDPQAFAETIAGVPGITREWAALLLTIAAHESALSKRIADGNCRKLECDRGHAWGLYQIHKNTLNAEAWGSTDLAVQTNEAARALRRAFYACNRGPLRADWVQTTISHYAGHGCSTTWGGLDKRVATFERLRRTLW